MVTRVVMPPLGDSSEAVVVSAWRKDEGDPVTKGDPLFEVETDKVTLDIEALGSGYVRCILVQAGEEAQVGDLLALIGELDDVLPSA